MSVGHVARQLEEAGVPTTSIYIWAFEHYARDIRVPRALITRHPMGRPVGPPGDADRQLEVTRRALGLIDSAIEGGAMVVDRGAYRPGGR